MTNDKRVAARVAGEKAYRAYLRECPSSLRSRMTYRFFPKVRT